MRFSFDIIKYVNHSTPLLQKMRYIQENILLYFETVIKTFCGSIQVSIQKICENITSF